MDVKVADRACSAADFSWRHGDGDSWRLEGAHRADIAPALAAAVSIGITQFTNMQLIYQQKSETPDRAAQC
ncbi:MAG TPA: hypothetical protein PKE16_15740 [Hyphomicrobium sp.]|nr:hypothetical protein [Hyphomicrobium sp.]